MCSRMAHSWKWYSFKAVTLVSEQTLESKEVAASAVVGGLTLFCAVSKIWEKRDPTLLLKQSCLVKSLCWIAELLCSGETFLSSPGLNKKEFFYVVEHICKSNSTRISELSLMTTNVGRKCPRISLRPVKSCVAIGAKIIISPLFWTILWIS